MPDLKTLLLSQLLNKQAPATEFIDIEGDKMPVPPPPGAFVGDPFISPSLAKETHNLFRIAPNLRNRVSAVKAGPTEDVTRMFGDTKRNPRQIPFERSNILGVTSGFDEPMNPKKRIAMNPRLTGPGAESRYSMEGTGPVLAHEMGHAAGYRHPINTGSKDPKVIEAERQLNGIEPNTGTIEQLYHDLLMEEFDKRIAKGKR